MTSALPWIGAALLASLSTGRWMLPFHRNEEELGGAVPAPPAPSDRSETEAPGPDPRSEEAGHRFFGWTLLAWYFSFFSFEPWFSTPDLTGRLSREAGWGLCFLDAATAWPWVATVGLLIFSLALVLALIYTVGVVCQEAGSAEGPAQSPKKSGSFSLNCGPLAPLRRYVSRGQLIKPTWTLISFKSKWKVEDLRGSQTICWYA